MIQKTDNNSLVMVEAEIAPSEEDAVMDEIPEWVPLKETLLVLLVVLAVEYELLIKVGSESPGSI